MKSHFREGQLADKTVWTLTHQVGNYSIVKETPERFGCWRHTGVGAMRIGEDESLLDAMVIVYDSITNRFAEELQ